MLIQGCGDEVLDDPWLEGRHAAARRRYCDQHGVAKEFEVAATIRAFNGDQSVFTRSWEQHVERGKV